MKVDLKTKIFAWSLPLLPVVSAFAQFGTPTPTGGGGGGGGSINIQTNLLYEPSARLFTLESWLSDNGVIDTVTDWLLILLLLIGAIFLVLAGFTYVTSGGDPEKVKSAKNKLIYAAIGIAVGLMAKAIYQLIGSTIQRV